MTMETLLGVINHQYPPSLMFCVGLFASVACCLISLLVESNVRGRGNEFSQGSLKTFNYQRFRKELVSFPRHLGFAAGEVQELEDHEFHSNLE